MGYRRPMPGGRQRRGRASRASRGVALASVGAAALLGLALAPPAEGALPPGYGGRLRLPATAPLRLPDPRRVDTPLEATLAHAVFDTLYRLDARGVARPSLALGPPERTEEGVLVRLREGIRRHDRRPLRARDVARSLDRAHRGEAAAWLAGFGTRTDGRLDVEAIDAQTLRLQAPEGFPVARRLAALPLAIVLGRGTGTGPFRPRMRGGALRLYQFRAAARGAPHLREVWVEPPRPREEELRAFELGELDGSWRGASLYGQARRPVEELALPAETPVLLAVRQDRPALRQSGAALAQAIDRRRLARAGLVPAASLAEGMPAPRLEGTRPPAAPVVLLVRADDQLQESLAGALAARFDELGWRLAAQRVPAERYDAVVERSGWDLRFVQAPPMLPGSAGLVASAFAALGDDEGAARVLQDALEEPDGAGRHAETLGALVLGHRRAVLHHRPGLGALSVDPLGRIRLGAVFLPRAETTPGD